MSFADMVFYHNPLRSWIIALAITLLLSAVARVIAAILRHRLAPLVARSTTTLDDALFCMLGSTKLFALVLVSAYVGRHALTLPAPAARIFSVLVILGFLVQVGIWGSALIVFLVRRYTEERREADPSSVTTMSALGFVGRLLLWTVLLLLALDNIGVDVTALIAGLGLTGIAVALALQNILGDLFASLSIVIDKPFVVGDSITVDTLTGTVEQVGLKTTRVRSVSGEQVIFGNEDLLKSRIRNFKRMTARRVVFTVGVVYGTPADRVAAIPGMIRKIIEQEAGVRFERCHFKSFSDSALLYETVYQVLDPEYETYMDIQQNVNLAIYRAFAGSGIEFAYPTRTIHLAKPDAGGTAGSAQAGRAAAPGEAPRD